MKLQRSDTGEISLVFLFGKIAGDTVSKIIARVQKAIPSTKIIARVLKAIP